MSKETPSPLDNAPDEIKLAVDLIYLLESNEVDIETALKAIEIVKSDLESKRLTS
ncbi:pleiotropic regulatory protein RsmS [Vibrio lamellibrachiae]|uniref:pleiotropic regulatory protein RsmS n=1 Tax=Vibrio lamellibrachiae TaxID=2910253 RepID=UPI003D141C46